MKKFLFTIATTALLLTGCAETYKEEKVIATVTEKDYDAPIKTKKRKKSAEYDVTIEYKDIELEVDDKRLYNKVKIGDKIEVIHEKGFDENGKLVSERLKLID